jgi:uncharacterized protein YciU (UPF0263 family)
MKIEYSTVCFTIDNYRKKIGEAKELLEREGYSFGIQLHNSISREMYDAMSDYRDHIPFTVHSPVFSDVFINLSSSDMQMSQAVLQRCHALTGEWNTDIVFFHGFFMTETPIVHDMKNYRSTMLNSIGRAFSLNNSFIMNPAIFETDLYMRYKMTFVKNYKRIVELFPDRIISLENDFTGIGSGLQRPAEIHELVDNLWFDLGHFWCSSLLHGFDFHEEAYRIIDKKKIVGVHLNHNLIRKGARPESIHDSHTHFYMESDMNLAPVVRKLAERGVDSLTLEIVDGDIDDVKILLDWLS